MRREVAEKESWWRLSDSLQGCEGGVAMQPIPEALSLHGIGEKKPAPRLTLRSGGQSPIGPASGWLVFPAGILLRHHEALKPSVTTKQYHGGR